MKFCNLHETKYDDELSEDDSMHPDAQLNHLFIYVDAPVFRVRSNPLESNLVALTTENSKT